ncbi:carbohydrate ABC transporter permease [Paenibacillus sacheonensis]|uniref:ABC transporter permease subunit n=1 Tax=Paenibacillus sacheonensis TaxID=742054 RepID=A0A7X4YRM9_9BACL|nr:carbohydrate ABC transporter permease [Paenibacillus sacheonensis]MBM7564905.1 putative aldouronate transport system permease protein [Paenibacillus sacheonensis]NBC70304.1 ABC transporter permease subunit [Paenibacillus sacheonensis]
MVHSSTLPGRLFRAANAFFLLALALLCLFPLVNVLAVSFSSSTAASAGMVKLWPVGFNLASYRFVLQKPEFMRALFISLERVSLGTAVNMLLTVTLAYPLAKESVKFRGRTFYVWFFVLTMLVSGGLIPWYMVIKSAGLLDSIWALILPGAVNVYNAVLLLNFFRGLPKELEEAAFVDGAGHWTILWRIFVPLSMPALATLILFTMVGHWNSWFDGMILMNTPEHYPLQSYLQTVVISHDLSLVTMSDASSLAEVSDRTMKSAQIFLAALPILCVYPFLQRFFIKGVVLGSVKE